MLFSTIDEIKVHVGFLYAYNNFNNLKTDIDLAEDDIKDLIGSDMFDVAQAYYDSFDSDAMLGALVKHIQLPLAYFAIHSFSQNNDISHEDSGRKVKIDSEREKLPWEWMLEKDERALLKKAHRTTDRLIRFLDENINDPHFIRWKFGEERVAIHHQFISNANDFDAIYPINKSRRFFLKIAPFIREAERKYILPVLTQTFFDDIKAKLSDVANPGITPAGIIPYIQVPLAFFAMAIAVERLNIDILPEGVFQNIVSDRLTQRAKLPPKSEAKREYSKLLQQRANAEISFLQEFMRNYNEGSNYTERNLVQGLDKDNKYARI